MKIHFVTEGTLDEYWNAPAAACDLLFFGFNGLGTVDYAQELGGVTSKLEDAAVLSRELGCTVVSGCATDSGNLITPSFWNPENSVWTWVSAFPIGMTHPFVYF